MAQTNPPPPTRIISWRQMVLDADPDFQKGLTRPWWYEMSNGRRFDWDTGITTRTGP